MLKVFFKKSIIPTEIEIHLYDSVSRIPFSMKINCFPKLSEPIYARNADKANFVEFRFHKDNKSLYELSFVSIDSNSTEDMEIDKNYKAKDELYICFINDELSILEDQVPMKLSHNETSLHLNWDVESQSIDYFPLSTNCLLGINSDSYLVSIVLTGMSQNNINNILGI